MPIETAAFSSQVKLILCLTFYLFYIGDITRRLNKHLASVSVSNQGVVSLPSMTSQRAHVPALNVLACSFWGNWATKMGKMDLPHSCWAHRQAGSTDDCFTVAKTNHAKHGTCNLHFLSSILPLKPEPTPHLCHRDSFKYQTTHCLPLVVMSSVALHHTFCSRHGGLQTRH